MKINYTLKDKDGIEFLEEYSDGCISFIRRRITPPKILELIESNPIFGSALEAGEANGYVGLPLGHKYYGMDYDSVDVSVHGGLTWGQEQEIKGEKYWVLGFDTHHFGDNKHNWPIYKVVEETKRLKDQL